MAVLITDLRGGPECGADLVGGKASQLGGLCRAGFPVPAGFVLTTAAYRSFVARNGLEEAIATREAERIREAFQRGALGRQLEEALRAAYAGLGAARVAVRSSATAEDLGTASFAGGQDTVLDVRGTGELETAVKRCWASLYTERVMAYRQRMGVEETGLELAVIVQEMVDARAAGVAFTVDPVQGDGQRVVIEACRGLGEALVSGKVTPDRFEVERGSLKLIRQQASGKDPGCLTRSEAVAIARMALAAEQEFGRPQDVEWALEVGGGLRVLQSRAVTAQAACWAGPVDGAIWVRHGCGGLVEYLPGPVSPLYATAQLPRICRLHDVQCQEMGVVTPVPTHTILNGYFYSRQDYRIGPGAVLLPLRYLQAARGAARRWRQEVLPPQETRRRQLEQIDLQRLPEGRLLWHCRELFEHNARAWDNAVRASRAYVVTEPIFTFVFRHLIGPVTGGDPVEFLRGYDSRVLDGERAMFRLVREALVEPAVERALRSLPAAEALEALEREPAAEGFLEQLRSYCREFGHMSATQDYMQATSADDASIAAASVASRMQFAPQDPDERLERLARQRERALGECRAKLARRPARRRLFEWARCWAQEGASVREDIFFYALRGWPAARRAVLELGRRMAEAGRIARAEDIFFLQWEEIEAGGGAVLAGKAGARRREHAGQARLAPPAVVPPGGPAPTWKRRMIVRLKRVITGSRKDSEAGLLRGAPVSSGTATGPARVLYSAGECGSLRPGDILVTQAATPDWTASFGRVAGLVTDNGGPLSHSSIIAREFGLPAVMGVAAATQAIEDGQWVTIDGGLGVVRLHARREGER